MKCCLVTKSKIMKKKFKEMVGKNPIKITVLVLVVVILILLKVDNETESLMGYISGIITELIGIVVTVGLIQLIFDRNADEKAREHERKLIIKYLQIFDIYLKQYKLYYNLLVIPIKEQDISLEVAEGDFITDIRLSRMTDIYRTTLLVCDNIMQPRCKYFFDQEKVLHDFIVKFLLEIEFVYYQEVQDLLQKFIDTSTKYNSYEGIMGYINMRVGQEKATQCIEKDLLKNGDEFVRKFLNEEVSGSNLLTPFYTLQLLMRHEVEILDKLAIVKVQLSDNKELSLKDVEIRSFRIW